MKKKVLSALLCASMVATMVAGCGGSSSETTDSNAAADNSAAAGTEEAAAPAASGDTIALRVWAAEEDQTLTNELIEQFKEANPDQTFDITVGVESEANAKDDILVDPTAAADVFAFASDQLIDLVDAGVLQAVQDLSLIHISEPTRQAEISYAVFCLKKKKKKREKQKKKKTKKKRK